MAQSTGISTTNIARPGAITVSGGANLALISSLQLLTPQVYKKYTEKYGNEDFCMWLSTFGGEETVDNDTFDWWENKGKLMQAVTTNAQVTAPAAGATVTVQITAADTYNGGTQSALRVGETVRIASSNVEGVILTVPTADSATIRPKKSTQAFVSAGSANLNAGEVLLLAGMVDVGEGSDSTTSRAHLDQKYTNYVTEIHETWSATDKAEMAEVFYNSGVSGSAPNGASQAGTSYFTYKGLVKANLAFKNNLEFKLMRGDVQNNTGLSGSKGTLGLLPKIAQDGQTVGYTVGSLNIASLHSITRVMDVQGCAKENIWLQDINQRQGFSDALFSAYAGGAWVYGENEKSQEAQLVYGAQSIIIDGYLFKVKKYTTFNSEVVYGKTPTTDFYRDFGVIIPQGETRDAKNAGRSYKSVQVMRQEPPAGGSIGNGIRVWQHGGGSKNPTNGKMVDNIEMLAYKGLRVTGANQFIQVVGS